MAHTYDIFSFQNSTNQQSPYTGGITMISDLHGDVGGLEETLRHAAQKDNAVAILGDQMGGGLREYASQFGYQFPSKMQEEFLQHQMNPEEFQLYKSAQILGEFDSRDSAIEYFTTINGEEYREQVKYEIDELSQIVSSDEFKDYINGLTQEFYKQNEERIVKNTIGLRSLESALKEIQFQQFAQTYQNVVEDTQKEIPIYWLDGNYEDVSDFENVIKYLPESKFKNIGKTSGYLVHKPYSEGENSSEEITFAGTPNIFQGIQSYKLELYTPEELQEKMPHMIDSSLHSDLLYKGEISKDNIESLEQRILSEDKEAQRITNNGAEDTKNLDLFLTHGPIRTPIIDEKNTGREDPFALVAAYFADNATITAQGHIHKSYAGEDSVGNGMVRPAGTIYDVYKINGEMKIEPIPTTFDYQPEEPVIVDKELLSQYHNYFYDLEIEKLREAASNKKEKEIAA